MKFLRQRIKMDHTTKIIFKIARLLLLPSGSSKRDRLLLLYCAAVLLLLLLTSGETIGRKEGLCEDEVS